MSKLSYELITQIIRIQDIIGISNEEKLCNRYGRLFNKAAIISSFEELGNLISTELSVIRDYINNCAYEDFPHIGDYATIIRELPHDILANISDNQYAEKIVFYLIDEFEGLYEWQQRIILSFLKYSDKYHTYKICMRPDGIKTATTVGAEYVRETDDVRTIDLNDLILEKRDDYYKYALEVCQKRMDLFYEKRCIPKSSGAHIVNSLEELTEDQEFDLIFEKKHRAISSDIDEFMRQIGIEDSEILQFFYSYPLDFYICRLIYYKNRNKKDFIEIYKSVVNKDSVYMDAIGNYKSALLYYLCLRLSVRKKYAGFSTLVSISGGTIRYLLEMCNEVFERAVQDGKYNYENPEKISYQIQTDSVLFISQKRVNQISAVPQIGLNMRTFVISLGNIFKIFHRDNRIAKFEPNHFAIKATNSEYDDNVKLFLRECVMRGVLLKRKNNKNKNIYEISSDEYMYGIHPVYTPAFQISWRNKQKADFSLDEIKTLISNNTVKINELIKKYQKQYFKDVDISDWNYYQTLMLNEDE